MGDNPTGAPCVPACGALAAVGDLPGVAAGVAADESVELTGPQIDLRAGQDKEDKQGQPQPGQCPLALSQSLER